LLELCRDWGLHGNSIARSAAGKCNAFGMKEVAAECTVRRSIELVAGHGMTDAGQMNANLMGAAGSDANFEKREFVKAP